MTKRKYPKVDGLKKDRTRDKEGYKAKRHAARKSKATRKAFERD